MVGPNCAPTSFEAPLMENADGLPLREPKTPQMKFKMQLPHPVPALSILRRAGDLTPGKEQS